jgi:methyl-accepting chemotaxis protein
MLRGIMKNFKISRQLFLLVACLMVAFCIASYLQIRASIAAIYARALRHAAHPGGVRHLHSAAYYDREKSGELTHEDRRSKHTSSSVAGIKLRAGGYFIGYDYDVVLTQFHYNPSKLGKSSKGVPDKKGKMFRDDIVAKGSAGGGIVDHLRSEARPAGRCAFRRASIRAFEPWQVIRRNRRLSR